MKPLARLLRDLPRSKEWIDGHGPDGEDVFRELCEAYGDPNVLESLLREGHNPTVKDLRLVLEMISGQARPPPPTHIRRIRKRPPAVPACFEKNPLGQVVAVRATANRKGPKGVLPLRPILGGPRIIPTAFEGHVAAAIRSAPRGARWVPSLLAEIAREKQHQISLRHVELDGFVQRLVYRRTEVDIEHDGATAQVSVHGRPLLVFRVDRAQVRPCVATFRKVAAKPHLHLPKFPSAFHRAFGDAAAAGDVWLALVDRGRGRYVEARALVTELSRAAFQRAGVRELVRVPKTDAEPAVLVLVTFEEATTGWEHKVVEVAARVSGEVIPSHVASPSVLRWLLTSLTFNRGGGAKGGLSFDRLAELLGGLPANLHAAMKRKGAAISPQK